MKLLSTNIIPINSPENNLNFTRNATKESDLEVLPSFLITNVIMYLLILILIFVFLSLLPVIFLYPLHTLGPKISLASSLINTIQLSSFLIRQIVYNDDNNSGTNSFVIENEGDLIYNYVPLFSESSKSFLLNSPLPLNSQLSLNSQLPLDMNYECIHCTSPVWRNSNINISPDNIEYGKSIYSSISSSKTVGNATEHVTGSPSKIQGILVKNSDYLHHLLDIVRYGNKLVEYKVKQKSNLVSDILLNFIENDEYKQKKLTKYVERILNVDDVNYKYNYLLSFDSSFDRFSVNSMNHDIFSLFNELFVGSIGSNTVEDINNYYNNFESYSSNIPVEASVNELLSYSYKIAKTASQENNSIDIDYTHPSFAFIHSSFYKSSIYNLQTIIKEQIKVGCSKVESIRAGVIALYVIGLLGSIFLFTVFIHPLKDRIKEISVETGELTSLSKVIFNKYFISLLIIGINGICRRVK
jgi:hypothetical protein